MSTPSRIATEKKRCSHPKSAPTLADTVSKLISDRRKCNDLVRQWQEAENALSIKAKSEGVPLDEAYSSNWPEAAIMDRLMKRIEHFDQRMPFAAKAILTAKCSSLEDAIATVRLGLSLHEPSPDDVLAWALVAGGFRELRHLTKLNH